MVDLIINDNCVVSNKNYFTAKSIQRYLFCNDFSFLQFQGKASILKTTVCSCSHCTNSVVKKTEYFEDESVASTSSQSPFSSEDRFRLNCIETKGKKI